MEYKTKEQMWEELEAKERYYEDVEQERFDIEQEQKMKWRDELVKSLKQWKAEKIVNAYIHYEAGVDDVIEHIEKNMTCH